MSLFHKLTSQLQWYRIKTCVDTPTQTVDLVRNIGEREWQLTCSKEPGLSAPGALASSYETHKLTARSQPNSCKKVLTTKWEKTKKKHKEVENREWPLLSSVFKCKCLYIKSFVKDGLKKKKDNNFTKAQALMLQVHISLSEEFNAYFQGQQSSSER